MGTTTTGAATTTTLAPTTTASAADADDIVAEIKRRAKAAQDEAVPLIGDVLDFALTSDDWPAAFGFVALRLHRGTFAGENVYYIRTDASDQDFATRERLVFGPKMQPLAANGLSGQLVLVSGGVPEQAAVFSSEPGQAAYTPAWRVQEATWTGEPRLLTSVADVGEAAAAGDLTVDSTDVVVNYSIIKWSSGELAADPALESVFPGALVEPLDTTGMTAVFKLHECYPDNRYIVTDDSIAPIAEMTDTILAPGLQDGPTGVEATSRTNIFLNGLTGNGPMGFQPSVFDFKAGDEEWSPFWDHFAYEWTDTSAARAITTQDELFAARDAGLLEEFPGLPDTEGLVFTVNCQVPILAPNTFPT